jgi:tetratricopeptide (TPR) repeat protein
VRVPSIPARGAVLALNLLLASSASAADPLAAAAAAFASGKPALVVELLPKTPTAPEARLLRGRALIALRRFGEAKRALSGLLKELPHLRDLVHYLLGEALLGAGEPAVAADELRAAARTKGSRWIDRAWQRRADALLAAGRAAAAAQEYRHVLRVQLKNPQRAELELALARCQEKLGDRRAAATALQGLWLQRPTSSAAVVARRELDRLRAAGVRLKPLTVGQLLQRIGILRRAKRYDEAIAALRELRSQQRERETRRELDRELATVLLAAGKPAEALLVLRALAPARGPAAPSLRTMIADCLARLGRVDEGAALFLSLVPSTGRLRAAQQEELQRAAIFLADHGRHAAALQHYERLATLSRPGPERRLRMAWLAHRAGRYDDAVRRLETSAARAGRAKEFKLYWQARARERSGQRQQAEALYRQVLAAHARTYYGLLSRSRLVEMGLLKLPGGTCPAVDASPRGLDPQTEVLPRLTALITRHGELYPSLRRVETLWRLGMLDDARRELRLVAIDAAWIAARGRPKEWVQRPEVERLWRGGPLERRRFGARERQVFEEGTALRHQLGGLLSAAGISYFAWQLSAPDADPERRRHPRAYQTLVLKVARQFKLDPNVIWAIMRTESTYRLDVISRVGATGLMQIMPNTARRIAAAMKLDMFQTSQLFEPEINVRMAGWYLRALMDKFKGQLPLVAAGYNGGPHHVARWLDQRGKGAAMDEFVEEIAFSESRRYAKKILRLHAVYERLYCNKDDRLAPNTLLTSYLPQPDF